MMYKAILRALLLSPIFLISSQAYSAYSLKNLKGHVLLEAGGYYSTQGTSQFVNVSGLIGNQYNVSNRNDRNAILGLGYLLEGLRDNRYGLDYGINAFYLAKTEVSGTITQENTFTNLSYRYYISHLPIYLFAKGFVLTNYNKLAITFDLGIGPNFMNTNQYHDYPLDSVTLPDNAYRGNFSQVTLSEMAGVGLRLDMTNRVQMEVGYRYFNLGEGTFNPRTNQILNHLKTGNSTAHAIIITLCA